MPDWGIVKKELLLDEDDEDQHLEACTSSEVCADSEIDNMEVKMIQTMLDTKEQKSKIVKPWEQKAMKIQMKTLCEDEDMGSAPAMTPIMIKATNEKMMTKATNEKTPKTKEMKMYWEALLG